MALGADAKFGDWVTACDAPNVADSSWNNPGGITRAEQHLVVLNPLFQSIEVRLKYLASANPSTTTMQLVLWGKTGAGTWDRLLMADGTDTVSITPNTSTDLTDGTSRWTPPVAVRLAGHDTVLVAVKTAWDTTDNLNETSSLEVRGAISRLVV